MSRPFRVRNQLVNRLLGEELAGQKGLLKRDASNGSWKQRCGAEAHQLRLYALIKMLSAWLCREPSSSSWAFWSRARIRGASWAPASCVPCALISCVLPCSVPWYLPCCDVIPQLECVALSRCLRISFAMLRALCHAPSFSCPKVSTVIRQGRFSSLTAGSTLTYVTSPEVLPVMKGRFDCRSDIS